MTIVFDFNSLQYDNRHGLAEPDHDDRV